MQNVDLDAVTAGGETPLMAAVMSGHVDVVTFCLEHNCNPFVYNCLGMSAKDYALECTGEPVRNQIIDRID